MVSRGRFIMATLLASAFTLAPTHTRAQPAATFKSSVDLVRVSAVVRDHKGRFVRDLAARDFEVLDGGQPKRISDFRTDLSGVSVALLFDVSGSMESKLVSAREAASHVLSWLDTNQDEAAIFTFDTHLDEVTPFTTKLKTLPDSLSALVPFGATSLHDAIAATARRVAAREGRRRAVVVLTDGSDNASHLTPIGSVGHRERDRRAGIHLRHRAGDRQSRFGGSRRSSADRSALAGSLTDLAEWTGGHVFVASTPIERSVAARQIVDELRHQYLIAFESSGQPGWHPLVVRARDKDLIVRVRSGYIAGQSRPITE